MDHCNYPGWGQKIQLLGSQNFQICFQNKGSSYYRHQTIFTILKIAVISQFEDAFISLALQLPTVNFGDCTYALMCSCLLLRIYHFPLKKTTSTCYRFKGDSTQPAVSEPIYTTAPKGDTFSAIVKKSITTYTQPLSTSICQVCNHHPHGIGQNQTKTHKRAKPTRQLLNQLNQDKTTQSLYRLNRNRNFYF